MPSSAHEAIAKRLWGATVFRGLGWPPTPIKDIRDSRPGGGLPGAAVPRASFRGYYGTVARFNVHGYKSVGGGVTECILRAAPSLGYLTVHYIGAPARPS
eukprot:762720-Hanusia_phi.AAC.3